jgi:hypothetical protein
MVVLRVVRVMLLPLVPVFLVFFLPWDGVPLLPTLGWSQAQGPTVPSRLSRSSA